MNKERSRFLAFARWCDLACLRQEDREPFELDNGKTVASLELRLVYAVGRAISAGSEEQNPDLVSWGAEVLDIALEAHPNDQWLHYYTSKRLIGLGQTAEAWITCSWLYAASDMRAGPGQSLGQDVGDRKTRLRYDHLLGFRAIQVAGKDVEVVGTRVQLAALLAEAERYAEATVQVRAAIQCREKNDYRIPRGLAVLAASDWYQRYADLPNLTREPDVAEAADALVFGAAAADLVCRLGVIDNQNLEKALAHVVFGLDDGAILFYRSTKVAEVEAGRRDLRRGWLSSRVRSAP